MIIRISYTRQTSNSDARHASITNSRHLSNTYARHVIRASLYTLDTRASLFTLDTRASQSIHARQMSATKFVTILYVKARDYEYYINLNAKEIKQEIRIVKENFSKLPYDFLKFNFSHFTPQVREFFVQKGKPKIFAFKNVMERGIRKILSFVIR